MTWREAAHGLVGYAVVMGVAKPGLAILSGMLGGVDAFAGGGFAIASLMFWEFYRAEFDDL